MRSRLPGMGMLAAVMLSAGPANAWLLYPDRDDPSLIIVEIEKTTGETVTVSALPVPFASSGAKNPVFLWNYERLASAKALFTLDSGGAGKVRIDFTARQQSEDLRFGAVIVLIGSDDRALHTLYARADLSSGKFPGGTPQHHVVFSVNRPQEWWQSVTKLAFFKMTYYPIQELDDAAIWTAMHRAVNHLTNGRGSEQVQK